MLRIGVTGQNGFIGKHIVNTLGLYKDKFEKINFQNDYFENESVLDSFVEKCDTIIHLAGMNRHENSDVIYKTNVNLAEKLIASLKRTKKKPHIVFSSSTQEERDNLYGKSKKEARLLLSRWANENGGKFSGLIIPNVFGAFGKPFYNSVVATFCYQLTRGETPKIDVDGEVRLIYVGELVREILKIVVEKKSLDIYQVPQTAQIKVSNLLKLLQRYKEEYFENGIIPELQNSFELNLFNTFRSYIEEEKLFPVKFKKHEDERGVFSEIIRLGEGVSGQVSFSTTVPGATRGNHFHTRKIERFAVIKGEALIQLRRVGTDKTMNFYLSGENPAFVDMPIWTTHNIKNIGNKDVYTIFWINELYDSEDPDTFYETV